MINVSSNKGYAKLDTFIFWTDQVGSDLVIDYGDGTSEFLNGETEGFSHVYDTYGIFSVNIRNCNSINPIQDNCVKIFVEPFVKDDIVFSVIPLSSYASTNSGRFEVCLSSSCDPPLKAKLKLIGNELPHISFHDDDYLSDCKPSYHFLDKNDEIIEDDILVIDDPAKIYVNGMECGYHGKGCFSFEYDGSGELIVEAELLNDCKGCLDLSVDYEECPLSSTYIAGASGIEMIDTDVF